MDYQSMMESIAEWMAVANTNGNLFFTPNGVQSQALSLTTSSGNSHQNSLTENGSSSGKTVSLRCVVESVPNVYWNLPHTNGHVEVDRRANVPVHTVFHNLVEAVLQIFGYPKETAITAKGSILLENWKPIRLEKVAINPQKTVNDILGEISSYVTLRIQILRTASCANTVLSQMKDKLLQLLIMQNIEHITSSGCPLDQMTLKNILRGTEYGTSTPSDDVLRKFEQWVISQSRQALRPIPYPSPLGQFPYHIGSPTTMHYEKDLIGGALEDRVHPALQSVPNQYPTQKTRMRTSFDPELELPKLQKWFNENQHPDRQQIRQYVDELNSLESRRGRKPLDINNVVYWFKNARAAQKRAETRNPSGHHNSLNGYRSDSHSPCETALTSKESLGSAQSCDEDYCEDEDNRSEGEEHERERDDSLDARPSNSPVAPLSLTTHKNNNNGSRNSSPVAEVKQEPPDKGDRENSPAMAKPPMKTSSVNDGGGGGGGGGGIESDSEDEDMEDDASETESVHKPNVDKETTKSSSLYANSSPLSLIPRSVNNSMFPVVPNYNFSMFSMGQYIPGMGLNMSRGGSLQPHQAHQNSNNHSPSAYVEDKRGKRNRTFIDPVTEVPCLESWFRRNTHPSHSLIRQYTDDLNGMPYRQKFPPLETKNVQFWFKNRRAKNKRMKTSLYENNNLSPEQFHQFAASLTSENYRNQE